MQSKTEIYICAVQQNTAEMKIFLPCNFGRKSPKSGVPVYGSTGMLCLSELILNKLWEETAHGKKI